MPVRLYADRRSCLLCDAPAALGRKGWCSAHYQRWQRHGDPLGGIGLARPRGMTPAEAFIYFMPRQPPTEGCWDWIGSTNANGYGIINMQLAHRVSYQIFVGQIPADRPFILHSCDRPICVQPAHLHPGTQPENVDEAVDRNRFPVGEARRNTKLTEAQVLWIRQRPLSTAGMADALGVSHSAIKAVLTGKYWKHLL